MPIPDFQTIMLPLLQQCADQSEHTLPEMEEKLALHFNLAESEIQEMLSSGIQRRFMNRISWAMIYLVRAGILEKPRRAVFKISPRGKEVLAKNLTRIDLAFLKNYPEYLDFIRPSSKNSNTTPLLDEPNISTNSPKELLDDAYQTLRSFKRRVYHHFFFCANSI